MSWDVASCSSVFSRALGFCRYADAEATKTTLHVFIIHKVRNAQMHSDTNVLHKVIQIVYTKDCLHCHLGLNSFAKLSSSEGKYLISAVLSLRKKCHQLDQSAWRCVQPQCELLCSECDRCIGWFSDVVLLFFCRCRNKVLSGRLLSPSQCTGNAPCPHKRPNVPRQCANLH